MEDFDILVYDFNLTKRETLHLKTIEIMNRFLPQETMWRYEIVEPILDL